MTTHRVVTAAVLLVAVFVLGRCSVGGGSASDPRSAEAGPTEPATPSIWTCPMHPEIRMPEFGDCPKCGMDLVPMGAGDGAGPRQLAMSPDAVALADIQTAPVERRFLTRSVRMAGKVQFDETRVKTIAARVGGRLDRLYVDYTGIAVEQNDHLVWLYSPELLTAQQELLEAKKRLVSTSGEVSIFLQASNQRGYQAARDKLMLLGLTNEQLDELETRGTTEDHMLIRSPAAGVVVHKARNEGDYVQEGSPIYRIADLSHLWVVLDAYEQDLPWVRYGQTVSVTTEAWPGRVFEGWISFLYPTVDERTRTVQVRVNVANPTGELKPGMFARGQVQVRVGAAGQVLEPRLQGKWISPMHPEVVKDGPGQCDICGMDLVPAESLLPGGGWLTQGKPLVVPTSAVLVTGRRAVAYVKVPGNEKPTFEGREVILGPRAGEYYTVEAGLKEGEQVVVHGAFRVDSAMQIQAKPSMLSMPGEKGVFDGPGTAVFRVSMGGLYESYDALAAALAGDDLAAAQAAVAAMTEGLAAVAGEGLPREAHARWHEEEAVLTAALTDAAEAGDLESLRAAFQGIARGMLAVDTAFGHPGAGMRYEAYCPMAFDNQGAAWLQSSEEIANPYFGADMLRCGELRRTFPGSEDVVRAAVPPQATPPDDPTAAQPEQPEPPTTSQPESQQQVQKAKEPEPRPDPPKGPDLTAVFAGYLDLQEALAADDFPKALAARQRLADAVVAAVPGAGDALQGPLQQLGADPAGVAPDVVTLRARFEDLTAAVFALHAAAGNPTGATLFHMHCPMAFNNRGAGWLQRGSTLANPYFGASMLRCGTTKGELPAGAGGR